MENDRLILPAIIIILILIVAVLIVAFAGNNTFNSGNLYFEYPKSWTQDHAVGDFSNNSLYSEVTLTANIPDSNNPTSYIVIQMQKKSQGTYKLPGTNEIVMNITNSTVGSTDVGNIRATQLATFGPTVAQKVTIVETADNYLVLEYICPPAALNQVETDYNSILQSLMLQ
ncbi:MAG: hypothetical protein ACXVHY_04205 [Methanobacterium sp.]